MKPKNYVLLWILLACCEDSQAVSTPPFTCRLGYVPKLIPIATAADILFVVDNSDSMCEEQENLARNFSAFITQVEKAVNDYQIGITTTDLDTCEGESACTCAEGGQKAGTGKLVSAQGNPKIITKSTPNMAQVFAGNVRVGTGGCGFEKGLDAMKSAISSPNTDPGGPNEGFVRQEVSTGAPDESGKVMLVVIIVSDEDDCSHPDGAFAQDNLNACETHRDLLTKVDSYVEFLKGLKGGDAALVGVAAIAGGKKNAHGDMGPSDCLQQNMPQEIIDACHTPEDQLGAFAGTRYFDFVGKAAAAGATGFFDTICSEDFSATLTKAADILFPTCRIELISAPDCDDPACDGELLVKRNGDEVQKENCWGYIEEDGAYRVQFSPDCCPSPGDKIEIFYEKDLGSKCVSD